MEGTLMARRTLYLSSNGDTWYLSREGEKLVVLHEPNKSSGGNTSRTEIGEFLMRGNKGPQHQALLDLIGELIDEEPSED
jgi:hypothetical protein